MKWTQQYTKGEAELSFLLRKWERMTQREIAEFQLFQDLLCVPYEIFKAALEAVLGRSVFDYEIQDNRTLIAEFNEVTIWAFQELSEFYLSLPHSQPQRQRHCS